MNLTREQLEKDHPVLFGALRDEFFNAGRAAGAAAEMQRIRDVEAQALPGHATLLATLKFDGKTTGPEAAAQVLAAERAKLGRKAEDIAADAADVAGAKQPASAAGTAPPPAAADKTRPVEERCKAAWETDASVRGQYASIEDYTAYVRAEESGRLRILGGKTA